MTSTQPTAERPTGRGPMAHRAPRAAGQPGAGMRRWVTHAPLGDALAAEMADLGVLVRRLVPNRRIALLVGLALLALVAVGGMAGAAEPKPVQRSALEAFAAPSVPAVASPADGQAASGPAASAGVQPRAGNSPVAAPAALADDPAFQGPNLLDLGSKTLLVVVLLFITLRVLRRVQGAGPARSGGMLSVLETKSIGPKAQLHLVAVGDRRLVIGQTPAGLVALGELDAAELPVPEPVREPWDRRDAQDEDPELEAQAAHELATGRRARLGISA